MAFPDKLGNMNGTSVSKEDFVKFLLENRPNAFDDKLGNTSRMSLSKEDIVTFFLEHGPNAFRDKLANMNGISFSKEDFAKFLLEHGQNAFDGVTLRRSNLVPQNRQVGIAEILMERRQNVSRTPLHHAVLWPHVDDVKRLLEQGSDVNALDNLNETPLHYALYSPQFDIVKLLLDHGADVNASDRLSQTPLHIAVLGAHADITKLLLDHEGNVNALDILNRTPLQLSVSVDKPDISIILTLMKYGADINAVVLSEAVGNPATPHEIIKLFLENGAIHDLHVETNILVSVSQPHCHHLAELLIQYIILKKSVSQGMYHALDYFKTVLINHIDSDNYNRLLRIAHSCIREIEYMRNDLICDEQTLFQLVSKICLKTTTNDQIVALYDIDALLLRLRIGRYVQCRELICASIKRSVLIEKLCELKVCCHFTDSNIFTLNHDCIDHLTEYLSKDDVTNMIFVFSDKFNGRGSKRSAEGIKENVCKNLTNKFFAT